MNSHMVVVVASVGSHMNDVESKKEKISATHGHKSLEFYEYLSPYAHLKRRDVKKTFTKLHRRVGK